jgi:hypothetical protein
MHAVYMKSRTFKAYTVIYMVNNRREPSTKQIYFRHISWGQQFKIYKIHEHLYLELPFHLYRERTQHINVT